MGARGPKPLPTNVKAFTGSSRRPMRAADLADGVHPTVGLPTPPKHLSPEARKAWKAITPELLQLGLLTTIDGAALELYCRAYGRLQQVERALTAAQHQSTSNGQDVTAALYQVTPTGFVRESILSRLAANLSLQVERYLASFGMSPSARSRVTASRNDAQFRLPGMDEDDDEETPGGFADV